MNCNELKDMLHALADDELTPERQLEARDALEGCPDCQSELDEIQAGRNLARVAFTAPVEDVDFSGFADAVMARVDASQSVEGVSVLREAKQATLWERIRTWFNEHIQLPMPVMAATAAVLLVLTGVFVVTQTSDSSKHVELDQASSTDVETKKGASDDALVPSGSSNLEEEVARNNEAEVLLWEVVEGRVTIEDNKEAPDQPVVVWHVLDEKAPDGGTTEE
jgi:anti-sigma factor RsiW